MRTIDRTALVVGGTSGIGLGLARRLAAAGSTVVVGGRDPERDAGRFDGLDTVRIDVTDPASVLRARDEVLDRHPDLDLLVTMSGVMSQEDLLDPGHAVAAETTVAVNLLGTMRVVDAFLPHLTARGAADVVTVSSGIAFLPFPLMPAYGASKAGVHAWTEALRPQLAGTGVTVTELVPPAVATAGQERVNPRALPLDAFLDEVLAILATEPTPQEVVVEAAQYLRWAERDGTYADLLRVRSEPLAQLPGR
ncbi:SDR family oxidoreductase [Curtobacterium sp. MCBA15_004]|uniref:SDR family oxidoreductase n=1 Tax=unclassified Curtobacterium TaxID=257496 RepID=UPI0008DE4DDE|nr:SDR family NAD(P)-dependent oxidoreductase [Curtobacterium sp. MCBA15_004]WIA98348.1 SDR family NAD(P)-dependent oxidoreductase [Curtobacterium sp. MCBA15_004]